MTLTGHGNTVHAVVYSSTGRRLITGDADGTIKIWDTADGRELWELRGDPSTIWNMNIGHDGSRLAVGHESGQVVVWELPNYEARATGRPEILLQFQHDDGRVVGVNFSLDDKILIVSAGRTSLYDAQTGEAIIDLVHPLGANDAVFSLDGGIVVTAGNDGLVRLMTANLDELLALARTRVTRSFSPVECQQYLHVAECPDE